jgi:uncharacterized protein YcnI
MCQQTSRTERLSRLTAPRGWVALACVLVAGYAQAHVSITPRQSQQGATEKYVVRIPTEGNVATIGADLEAPEGVIIETLQIPAGWTYEVKRADDRIVSIAWNVDVKPGEFIEVAFVARNPRQGTEIVWTLRQRFADGTVTDWTNGPNGIRPTARTALTPRQQ